MGAVVAGANIHDTKLLKATIDAIVTERPDPTAEEQHLCLDKAFDNPTGHQAAAAAKYTPHIRPIGEDAKAARGGAKSKHKPRRWVVERTHAWLSKCRAILVRFDKHARNFLGLLQLACGLLWYRRLHRLKLGNQPF